MTLLPAVWDLAHQFTCTHTNHTCFGSMCGSIRANTVVASLTQCSEISTSWSKVSVLDVRAKKKDTCKIAPEFKDSPMMRKVHMLGVVVTKAKKKKAAAKKK